jgi:MFS family permease
MPHHRKSKGVMTMTIDREAKSYGNNVVFAAWLAVFCLFGWQSTFSILKAPMSRDLGWSHVELTLGYSIMMLLFAVSALVSGWMLDRWGAKPAYSIAAILGAAGLVVTGHIYSPVAALISCGILVGIAMGMLWVSATVSVRKWYVGTRYATMWGIAFAGAPISQLFFGFYVKEMLYGSSDGTWRGVMQVLAAVVLVALLIAVSKAKDTPETYGMKAFGSMSSKNEVDATDRIWTVSKAFSTYPVWGVVLTFLTSVLAECLIWTRVIGYWHADLGMSLWSANRLYVVISVVGIFSIPIMGIIADRVVGRVKDEVRGRKIMLIAGPAMGAVACVFLLAQTQTTTLLGLVACFIFAVYWAIVPGGVVGYAGAIYGRKALGKIWGLATLIVMTIGPLVGLLVGDYLRDISGGHTYSIVLALCAFSVSTILACSLPLAAKNFEERGKATLRLREAVAHRPH